METGLDQLTDFEITALHTDTLAYGVHTMSVRAKDSVGQWGLIEVTQFVVDSIPKETHVNTTYPITKIEYFIDQDPGAGNGIEIDLIDNVDSLTDFEITMLATDTFAYGPHTINVRVQDSLGRWSLLATSHFSVDSTVFNPLENDSLTKFIGFEYYFDTLNHLPGNGTYVAFDSPLIHLDELDLTTVSTPPLSLGEHTISIRLKQVNGAWGHTFSQPFEVCLSPEDTPKSAEGNTLCYGEGYTAISAFGSPTGEYAWYNVPSGGTPVTSSTDSIYAGYYTENTTMYVASKGTLCNSNRLPVNVFIWDDIPAPVVESVIHCGPNTFDLSPSGKPEGGSYFWYESDTSSTPFHKGDHYEVTIDSTIVFYVAAVTDNEACISDELANVVIAIKSCKPQTIIFPTPQNAIFGIDDPQVLTAYSQDDEGVKTGLPITYEIIEGSNRAYIQNDSIFYTGIGVVKIRAYQVGDTNHVYNAAVPVVVEFSILADAAEVVIVHNSPICGGEKLTLSPTLIKDATYHWEGPNNFSATKRVVNILPVTEADSGRYNLQVITSNDTLVSSVYVEVKPQAEQVYLNVEEIVKCSEKSFQFEALGGMYQRYEWHLNGTSLTFTDTMSYTPLFTGVYHVEALDTNQCPSISSPIYVDLTPDSLPVITHNVELEQLEVQTAESYQWYINELFIVDATNKTLPVLANGEYKVVTTNLEGCTYVSLGFVIDEDGLPNIDINKEGTIQWVELYRSSEVYVAPNPVHDQVSIYLKYRFPQAIMQIMTSQGVLVYEATLGNEKVIHVPSLQLMSGLYIVRIIGEHYTYKTTFVK